jgi:methyl-accepting chemotaxis protein
MKLKYIILPIIATSFAISSCNNFLDREPLTDNVNEGFFTEPSQLQAYCNKKYELLPDFKDTNLFTNDQTSDNQAKYIIMDTNKPLDNASDRLDEARDRTVNSVENTAENMSERAKNFADDVKDTAENAWEKTKDVANDIWEKTKDVAENVKDKTEDMIDDVKDEYRDRTH